MAALISVITGHFKGFILFSLIIIVHELGHILMGILFKWKIDKVIILPFGALTVFNEDLNRKTNEEAWIVIMGPIFQIVFTFFLYELINESDVLYYSSSILCFNLLPIFPLDGSKILNLILNKIVSFKRSHVLIIVISLIVIGILVLESNFNLLLCLIIIFLLMRIFSEIKNHESLFNRFLLERYLKNYHFKKTRKVNSLDVTKMKRDYRHLFFDGFKYISERERLKKRFDFKGKV